MLKTGEQYLQSLRDGRQVYVGDQKVDDITTHPAFCDTAQSFARLYEIKRDPKNTPVTAFRESGEPFSRYYHMPTHAEDLELRYKAHKALSDASYGLLGRSPDYVASLITGLALDPGKFDTNNTGLSNNILAYYHYLRSNDLYPTFLLQPSARIRHPNLYGDQKPMPPTLRVTCADEDGVVLNGVHFPTTGAVYCHEIYVGNPVGYGPDSDPDSITFGIAANTPGLNFWCRAPFSEGKTHSDEYPLSPHFDESDAILVFEDVRIPWSRVFTYQNTEDYASALLDTPSYILANHQSCIRFLSKIQFLIGLARCIAEDTGALDVPAVRETLGVLASYESNLAAMLKGQIGDSELFASKYVIPNKRYLWATVSWCQETYPKISQIIRELMGGSIFHWPADSSILQSTKMNALFNEYWSTRERSAHQRFRLHRIAWDLLGSEFGARHMQYENNYAGLPFVIRNRNFLECPWDQYREALSKLLTSDVANANKENGEPR